MGRNWKDLIVWQRAHSLVLEIYKAIAVFPAEEKYSLVDQIRRCSYSIPANIVEGHSKSTSRDFCGTSTFQGVLLKN
ncbi:MAG: four helix bundle protein [Spirochaetota bacterium]